MSAVKYYLTEDVSQEQVCNIFKSNDLIGVPQKKLLVPSNSKEFHFFFEEEFHWKWNPVKLVIMNED